MLVPGATNLLRCSSRLKNTRPPTSPFNHLNPQYKCSHIACLLLDLHRRKLLRRTDLEGSIPVDQRSSVHQWHCHISLTLLNTQIQTLALSHRAGRDHAPQAKALLLHPTSNARYDSITAVVVRRVKKQQHISVGVNVWPWPQQRP
jgi:hypothetical protein